MRIEEQNGFTWQPRVARQGNPLRTSTLQDENLVDNKEQSHGNQDDEKDEEADHSLVVVCEGKTEVVKVTRARKTGECSGHEGVTVSGSTYIQF